MQTVGFREGEQAFIVARYIKGRRKIDLEEVLGDRAFALVVEALAAAVGKHAPPEIASRQILDAAQIAQHLGRGSGFLPSSA